jgi:hypothetical protein
MMIANTDTSAHTYIHTYILYTDAKNSSVNYFNSRVLHAVFHAK